MRLMGIMEHHSKESGVVQVSHGHPPGTVGVASARRNDSSVTGFPTAPIVPTAPRNASLGGASRFKGKAQEKADEEMVDVQVPPPALAPTFPYSITAGVEKGAKNR